MHFRLNTTHDTIRLLPAIGLGSHKLGKEAIKQALEIGYRHIDTATGYGNHLTIAEAIKESGMKREELFLTTKINEDDLQKESVDKLVDKICRELNTKSIDLLLIHGPRVAIVETIQKMQKQPLVDAIGVSNFTIKHLEIMKKACLKIAVNQIEVHPYLQQEELFAYCQNEGIHIMAYRPLCKGKVFEDVLLTKIGHIHGKNSGQIALKWALQRGFSIIPRSSVPERQKSYLELFDFELSPDEMALINKLNCSLRTCHGSWSDFE
jgi:diketogulonate reductase-like aldo/keto reductase